MQSNNIQSQKSMLIAYYLPQFHPTENNNRWWGEGFTEWTNVAKASKLFKGHYQPHIPKDLGFYDLRLPSVREKQAEMARFAGVSAFCYYHYWFGEGREELDIPFKEVVKTGNPDFPFCLCWANESWFSKMWTRDGSVGAKKLLIEQKYLGEQDNINHFDSLLSAFNDHRYLRYDGKLVFVIYRPLQFDGIAEFISLWRRLARNHGLNDFYFIGYSYDIETEYKKIIELGFDGVNSCGIINFRTSLKLRVKLEWIKKRLFKRPEVYSYKEVYPKFINKDYDIRNDVFPTIIPNWDHTPRSGINGYLFEESTPELFNAHVKDIKNVLENKNNPICFLKSWNEWGEGNYVEPDLKYGWGYLNVLNNFFKK